MFIARQLAAGELTMLRMTQYGWLGPQQTPLKPKEGLNGPPNPLWLVIFDRVQKLVDRPGLQGLNI
jgi:hypothetical protein